MLFSIMQMFCVKFTQEAAIKLIFIQNQNNCGFLLLFVEVVVGFDDALDEGVADDVLLAEFDFSDAGDIFQHTESLNQTRGDRSGKVDLRSITGDNRPFLRLCFRSGRHSLGCPR